MNLQARFHASTRKRRAARDKSQRPGKTSIPPRCRLSTRTWNVGATDILMFLAEIIADRPPCSSPKQTRYCGLVADYPPIDLSLFQSKTPPRWFVVLAGDVVENLSSKPEAFDVEEAWKKVQLKLKDQFDEQQAASLKSLCSLYRIDVQEADAGWKLAKALAAEHVPAFQVKRAVEMRRKRHAKKPTKLDVHGSACFFLEKARKARALSPTEIRFLELWGDDFHSTKLRPSTVRQLDREMENANSAYFQHEATDFQRQFVEEVDPLLMRLGHTSHMRPMNTWSGSSWANDARSSILGVSTAAEIKSAYRAYSLSCETDYQKYLVEQVDPFALWLHWRGASMRSTN
jgi:hypothetical protein